ncbi:hypothetical protein BDF14DRAFT_1875519 [Spinellus fusiger]|nr:hypothetical protein BDF14DRAFT_1875519 [Spinellus fusiger]
MHPRNRYKDTPPDFEALADVHSLGSSSWIDFKNPEATRLNYILWLQDLVEETLPEDSGNVMGMDIGVGASCIYPLLGCRNDSSWSFIATDINKTSLECAQKNVQRNHLQHRIELIHNDDPNTIFLWDKIPPDIKFSFCMSNPPFYASQEEIMENASNKLLKPSATCMGTMDEMVTHGGEYGFIGRMIEESLQCKTRIMWFTSMIGQKKTLQPIVKKLKQCSISNYVISELNQGKTRRWTVAWSFHTKRVIQSRSLDYYRPKPHQTVELPFGIKHIENHTGSILKDLGIEFDYHYEAYIMFKGPKCW